MSLVPSRGSVASKKGYEYSNKLMNWINTFDTLKNTDQDLYKTCVMLCNSINIDIKNILSIKTKNPLNSNAKPDFILCLYLIDGSNQEIGVSVKKGSDSSISFNNQSLDSFIDTKFKLKYKNACCGLGKWIGLDVYKSQWLNDYGHEVRPSCCYLLEELELIERQELISLCRDEDFLINSLHKILVSNNQFNIETAKILIYPRVPESMKAKDFVICNLDVLINDLLISYRKDKNIVQNIDPNSNPKPGIRIKSKSKNNKQNTIVFYNGLFHIQRKSGGTESQTNLLVQVNLKSLDIKQKSITKSKNQANGGINTFKNKDEFRSILIDKFNTINISDYLIRSSPKECELFKENLNVFWLKNKHKFNFSNCNEKDVFEGIAYLLGVDNYTPIHALQNQKIERINKNDLLNLKSLPFMYLKGSIRQDLKVFFDENIEVFLDATMFSNRTKEIKGIICNKSVYGKTKIVEPIVVKKEEVLRYAVNMYHAKKFNEKKKSLDLGICYLKRYGGGGKNASNKVRSALSLSLNSIGFTKL